MSEMRGFVTETLGDRGSDRSTALAEQSSDRVAAGEIADLADSHLAEIASLSTQWIMEMSRGELANLIRRARMKHLRPGMFEQLTRMDEANLRRLAFATRRYCRDQSLMLEGIFPDVAQLGDLSL